MNLGAENTHRKDLMVDDFIQVCFTDKGNYISSIKDEISEEQLKLKRVSDLIAAYEKIVEGNYIDNLIRARRELEQNILKKQEKAMGCGSPSVFVYESVFKNESRASALSSETTFNGYMVRSDSHISI